MARDKDDPKYFLDRGKAYGYDNVQDFLDTRVTEEAIYRRAKKRPYLNYKKWASKYPEVIDAFKRAEPEARIFTIERRQMMEFESADWDDFNPDFCVPPYTSFFIRPAHPLPLKYGENLDAPRFHEELEQKGQLYLIDILVDCTDEDEWLVIENLEFERKGGTRRMPYSIATRVRIEDGICCCVKFDDEWAREGVPQWFSIRDKYFSPKGQKLIYTEAQVAARDVISFLHLLNNRKTEVRYYKPEGEPNTRAERRQAAREGWSPHDHYRVTIPKKKTVYELVGEAVAGKSLRYRRPHWVRGHYRKIKTRDERVPVKPHKRCGDPGDKYIPDYDVGRVRPDDLEDIAG